MWHWGKPVRHKLPEARWPAREEAARSLLFSPIRIGNLTLESRTWVPAMVPWRATEDGFVTRNILDWYARFASGRPAAIVVEATGVRDIPSGPLLRIGHDRFIPGLAIASYMVGDEKKKTVAVIDPTRDVDEYIRVAKDEGLHITHILETHVHADYVSGSAELKVRNYSTKTKNIAVAIPVTPSQFHEVGEAQRREFVLKSTLDAITAAERRLQKRHLHIDFDLLRHDVESTGQAYLNIVPN